MNFLERANRVLARSMNFMGQDFVYNGETLRGVINQLQVAQSIVVGGYKRTLSCIVAVSVNVLPEPVIGTRCVVNGVDRRIVAIDSDAVLHRLHLEDITQ